MDREAYGAIRALADKYAADLKKRVDLRTEEMKGDDTSHYLIYRVLGVSDGEGDLIDLYQNKGGSCINMPVLFGKRPRSAA